MSHWWTSTAPGKSHLALVDFDEFAELVREAPPHRYVSKVILHHTWVPTVADYRGADSWHGIRRYHMESNGWSDIGYHLGIGPDESIWLLRPLQRTGAHCLGQNERSIGVCMLGNYDVGADECEVENLTARCIAEFCKRFRLQATDVWFHNSFSAKTCPGSSLDLGNMRALVGIHMGVEHDPPTSPFRVIEHATGRVLWPPPEQSWSVVEGGDHIEDQGKVYVR